MCDMAEEMFTVDNPRPKPGVARLLRRGIRRQGIHWRDLIRDGIETMRVFR
jgi:electron transfer flavoprotein-quinone oxidoreductase